MNIYTLKVIDIRKETDDTITLCFKQPGLKRIKYLAGQYLTLIFRINGRRYIRPYSFSSAPATDTALEVTIKKVPKGIVSNHIHDVIKIGDSIETMSPMGDFVCDNYESKDIFLWGVGSGITPLISIAKQILAVSEETAVNLIYGNRSYDTTIFFDTINQLVEQKANRFKAWHFHTQLSVTEELPFVIQGRINYDTILDIMSGANLSNSQHYICGPLGLKESIKEVLFKMGVTPPQIFSEDFELIKSPRDFDDIQTRVIQLSFEGKEYELEIVKGKSILEAALDAGIELPYSCQTGNCNTCMGKIQYGQLKMIGLNSGREDLLPNEYLLCCSHPITDDVYVKV